MARGTKRRGDACLTLPGGHAGFLQAAINGGWEGLDVPRAVLARRDDSCLCGARRSTNSYGTNGRRDFAPLSGKVVRASGATID